MKRSRVHVMGASGSGTTTLARALADVWSVPHADADDYFWVPSIPPYVEKRSESERVALMRQLFVPREAWVVSGSMVGWGEAVVAECDAVIFLTLDSEERIRRIEERENRRRAGLTHDDAAWQQFVEWAAGYDTPEFTGRSRAGHEAWLANVGKPVLRLDSSASIDELLGRALDWDVSPKDPPS